MAAYVCSLGILGGGLLFWFSKSARYYIHTGLAYRSKPSESPFEDFGNNQVKKHGKSSGGSDADN